ncbi:uncharacterized protein LOC132756917 [Ruditapes philippinarum]|uniref:uncharacterized protein LOC132756917 n=1 Tax=Ruditapes philippinarum TaxID=129788 RepID=UPI00295B3BD6|nr:uncharacterized protein LOC132756917 [Ruditapes philippinarum]
MNGYTCRCTAGYEGINCETVTNVPIRRKSMQFVFRIDVTDIDLSSADILASVSGEISQYFKDSVGESFRRIMDVLLSPGSLVADFVAEYEDNEVTASDFTKANVDLITGEKTIKLLNQTMSPSTIKVGDKKVASETGPTETIICEIFLEVNGECPAEEHCVVETRIPACVKEDQQFGLTFVVVVIVCVFAAVILIMFIICFPIRGYRLRKQKRKRDHHIGSQILEQDGEWSYHRTVPSFSSSSGLKHHGRGYISNQGHAEHGFYPYASRYISRGRSGEQDPTLPYSLSHKVNPIYNW